ncbi:MULTISPECIES: non-hydrolyzing UDP-N-acetylglucosamine 2-epimerase [Thalassospira]|uniref:UDP-N-acetylglucosamine 2-epimerase (non-hydrolyzing) n=1 Tax=Thalassospira aquimaris TaxID=3037796 RepID=A0ABT6G5T0_9PROT|nr:MULTISPECIES: UDP-N-acetylglucosamine 2-epimerase (non-hydrolyzing) [Thalassospira]MDG4717403.1 UDP-N-acetylglucosamine 2-epimerase (non-hydrolyzing) [Thalassospira sp. FZY0004]
MTTNVPKHIAIVAGTRPEFIKLAPVIRSLRAKLGEARVRVYSTGQHRSLMDQAIHSLHLKVDVDFDLMTHAQPAAEIQRRVISALDREFQARKPDLVVVQGDTISAFGGAMAGFLNHIPVAHVEAGLRSHNINNPWPEEGLRQMIARIASIHLAPTPIAKENLLQEGIAENCIHIVGNPGIDSLVATQEENSGLQRFGDGEHFHPGSKPFVLVTMHRREALQGALDAFCENLEGTVKNHPEIDFVWPVHPNPKVRETVERHFDSALPNLHFVEPLPYDEMMTLLPKARVVISDSGGMQEEAPYCGVPIIVMRDVTERPEIIDLGLGKLAGACGARLSDELERTLSADVDEPSVNKWRDIQGRGQAAEVISEILIKRLAAAEQV